MGTTCKTYGIVACFVSASLMPGLPAAHAGGGCTTFNDQLTFESFVQQQGKFIKGVENFEEGFVPLPPGIAILFDPLEGNVPNTDPRGLGFPNGITEKNLIIQSNILGENAPFEAPGAGLEALGMGFIDGAVPNSIVVGTQFFSAGVVSDSLDLIFTLVDNHTAVGVDVIRPGGGPNNVRITVFGKIGNVVFEGSIQASQQKTFFGIWCPDTIGRINIARATGPNDGPEYVDNIQLWLRPSPCTVFNDRGAFAQFNQADGKFVKGFEDFEPPVSNLGFGEIARFEGPLVGNVPNVDPDTLLGFPGGLLNKNLRIQSNLLGPNAPAEAPGGALVAIGPGFIDPVVPVPNSVVVGPQAFADSLDLIFDPAENHTGIGFDVADGTGVFGAHISVFDKNNVEMASELIPVTPDKTFFGIWCPDTIGRINVDGFSAAGGVGGELVDNIEMWLDPPPPCPWDCQAAPQSGAVDVPDLLALLGAWGGPQTPGTTCDLDGSGAINVIDLLDLLANWGPCP